MRSLTDEDLAAVVRSANQLLMINETHPFLDSVVSKGLEVTRHESQAATAERRELRGRNAGLWP